MKLLSEKLQFRYDWSHVIDTALDVKQEVHLETEAHVGHQTSIEVWNAIWGAVSRVYENNRAG